jgi:ribosomal-protein-alanine N-acetyltransferase
MAAIPFPIITSERLILNELKKTDRKQVFDIFSDPKVTAHYDVERFKDIKEADHLIKYFSSRFETKTGIRWAIRKKGEPKLIGSCGFNSWNEYDASVILGYDLAPKHWRKGFASEAVKCILDYAFGPKFPININRVESLILPSNLPSISVTERAGFEFEGVLREKCFWNGAFHDMNLYSLIRKDYEAGQK